MSINTIFEDFRRKTDDVSAAVLTLASIIAGQDQKAAALLTVKQAAERLNVAPDTIYEMCGAGKLRHQRVGNKRGTIRIRQEDVDAMVETRPPSLRSLIR